MKGFVRKYCRRQHSIWANLLSHVRAARSDGGIHPLHQLFEIVWLRLSHGKLAVEDYYALRLYRRDLSKVEKAKYIHGRVLWRSLPGRNWKIVADDKLLTYAVLANQGFRTPKVYAVVHAGRQYGDARPLRDSRNVIDYLRNGCAFPCVAKPIASVFSRGVYVINAADRAEENVHLKDGTTQPLKDFAESIASLRGGYMFQELLRPHPSIAQTCGDNLCTVRMVSLYQGADVGLLGAYWKIAVEPNMADNYWRQGNLLALVDPMDGSVERCSTGLGPDYRRVEAHPVTHKALAGFRLPDWDEAVRAVSTASRAFPGIAMQAWDVALTDEGPRLLEVNIVGSQFLPQLALQRGLYQGEFRKILDSYRG